ncbi:MAG: T9SS type A sorting domain-containing protein [Bacteroidetes bacterium]|nr:T9SS type A sorting domain-containing protein [Bacteroidota bacterium]
MKKYLLVLSLALVAHGLFSQAYPTVELYAGAPQAGLVDGPVASSRFRMPYGLSHDPLTDAIYVADAFNHCIRKIQNGMVTTVAGSGQAGDADGQGAAARFNTPTGVCFKNGFLYICDDLNSKIKRMDGAGNVVTIAGTGVEGFLDGPATQARFRQPKRVVVDDAGVVYVTDYENHRIRKIVNDVVSTYAGTGAQGDGLGPALSAALHRPADMSLAPNGDLYFTDLMNNKVKVVRTNGMVELIAGSGALGGADGSAAQASFSHPPGLEWYGTDTLLVVDAIQPRLRMLTTAGQVTTIAGNGQTGYVNGPSLSSEFAVAQDACMDNAGNIYLTDRNNNNIRILRRAVVVQPCTAMAAPVQAGSPVVCLSNGQATIAGTSGASTVPEGYGVAYLLAQGTGHTVVQVASAPVFTVTTVGTWSIHTLVYDPATFDPSSVELGSTSIADLLPMFVEGGGDICASLDAGGAAISTLECPTGCDQDQWSLSMGGAGQQVAHSVLAHSSGDLFVGGYTSVGQNILLVRMTVQGDIVWSRSYDMGANDNGTSVNVEEASDGGVFISGTRGSAGAFLMKTTADGAVQWNRVLFPQWTANLRVIRPSADGSVLVAGTVNAGVFGSSEGFIGRLDQATGDLQWSRMLGGAANDHFTDLSELADGTIVLSGEVQSFGGIRNGWYVHCAADGTLLASQQYGGSGNSAFIRHVAHPDGTFTRVGLTDGSGQGGYDIWVARTSASGQLLWSYTYGTSHNERGASVTAMPDGGVVIAAVELDTPAMYWLRLDAAGAVQWAFSSDEMGSAYPALYASMITRTADGSFVVIGSSPSASGDLRVIKTGGCGAFACGANDVPLVREAFNAAVSVIPNVQVASSTSSTAVNVSMQDGTAAMIASSTLEHCTSGECNAKASGMAADIGPICLVNGEATLTASPSGTNVVPPGYQVAYLLSRTNALIIEQVGPVPEFTVNSTDIWRIHGLVYDPATLDLSTITPGTYAYDLQALLVQGGGTICASLDISGAPIKTGECPQACMAKAAGMTADIGPVCLENGAATLVASPAGADLVPPGYAVAYVLTRTNALIIEQVGTTPAFTVTSEDIWRIHSLVYDPSTLDLSTLVPGTYAYDLQHLLVQGGGAICASLDISGAPIKTGFCEGTPCSGGGDTSITVCYTDPPFFLFDLIPGDPCPLGVWSAGGEAQVPANGWFDPAAQTSAAFHYTAFLPDGSEHQVIVNVTLIECPGGIEEDQPEKGPMQGIATGVAAAGPLDGPAVWPNPASGTVHVRLPYGLTTGTRIELIDAAGRAVAVPFVRTAQGLSFDTEALAAGAWTLRVIDQAQVFSARFVRVGE